MLTHGVRYIHYTWQRGLDRNMENPKSVTARGCAFDVPARPDVPVPKQAITLRRQAMSQRQPQSQPATHQQQLQRLHVQSRAAAATAVGGSIGSEATVFAFDFDGETVGFCMN